MTKTISVPEEHAAQTDIRLRLLSKGYRPLPTAEKVAFIKGWPSMPVHERVIRDWPMMGPNMKPAVTTAIQLEGTMLAIDVDVQDQKMSEAIEDLMFEVFGDHIIGMAPLRTSGGAKFMVLVQIEKPFGMWKTPKYVDPDGREQMVEVYGGASTRYFSCFGPHTLGNVVKGRYEVLKEYRWEDGVSPLDIAVSQLPMVTEAQLNRFLMLVSDMLAAAPGWEKVVGSRGGAFEGGVSYDLEEDMLFDTADGRLTYWQAVAYATTERDARCSCSFIRDDPSGNTSKCRMRVVGEVNDEAGLALSVFDHETWKNHLPKSWAPRTAEQRAEKSAALGDALRRLMPDAVRSAIEEAQEQDVDTASFEDGIEYLLENLALNDITGAVHYLDRRSAIWSHVSLSTVKSAMAHLDLTWVGPRGGNRRFSVVDAWRAYDEKLKVSGVRFDPTTPNRVYTSYDGATYANGFFGLPEPAAPSAADMDTLQRFLEHLVPDDDERHWLIDWVASKYQRPWERNCAVLFVAAGVQGAGRGTFFTVLNRLFNGYTEIVGESDLLGGRFNGFLENNLMVFCNEVGGRGWADRKAGYEVLKDRVDPSQINVTIERKGLERYTARTYVSFMLASNQPGALPFDAEDRRIAVITNGGKLEGELLTAVISTGADRLAAALHRVVEGRVITSNLSDAPMFAGREQMLTANETDLDVAIEKVVQQSAPWRSWVRSDFEKAVKLEMTGSSTAHVPGLRRAISELVGRRADRAGVKLLSGKVKVGCSSVAVLTRDEGHLMAADPDDRAKICAGVPAGAASGRVVAF